MLDDSESVVALVANEPRDLRCSSAAIASARSRASIRRSGSRSPRTRSSTARSPTSTSGAALAFVLDATARSSEGVQRPAASGAPGTRTHEAFLTEAGTPRPLLLRARRTTAACSSRATAASSSPAPAIPCSTQSPGAQRSGALVRVGSSTRPERPGRDAARIGIVALRARTLWIWENGAITRARHARVVTGRRSLTAAKRLPSSHVAEDRCADRAVNEKRHRRRGEVDYEGRSVRRPFGARAASVARHASASATGCACSCSSIAARRSSSYSRGSASARATRSPGKTGLAHLFEHLMFNETRGPEGRRVRSQARGGRRRVERRDVARLDLLLRVASRRTASASRCKLESRSHGEARPARAAGREREGGRRERAPLPRRRRRRGHRERAALQDGVHEAPVPLADHRLDGRHRELHARGLRDLLPDVLRAEQRDDRRRRRRARARRARRIRDALRRASPRPTIPRGGHAPEPPQLEERRVDAQEADARPRSSSSATTARRSATPTTPPLVDPERGPLRRPRVAHVPRSSSRRASSPPICAAGSSTFRDPGLYEMYFTARAGKTQRRAARACSMRELDARARRASSPTTSSSAPRRASSSALVQALETASGKAEQIGFYDTVLGDPAAAFRRLEAYRRVTAGDMRRVARRYLAAACPHHRPRRARSRRDGGRMSAAVRAPRSRAPSRRASPRGGVLFVESSTVAAARVDRRRAPERRRARSRGQGGPRAHHRAHAPPRLPGPRRRRRSRAPSTASAASSASTSPRRRRAVYGQVLARNLEPFVELLGAVLSARPTFRRGRARAAPARDDGRAHRRSRQRSRARGSLLPPHALRRPPVRAHASGAPSVARHAHDRARRRGPPSSGTSCAGTSSSPSPATSRRRRPSGIGREAPRGSPGHAGAGAIPLDRAEALRGPPPRLRRQARAHADADPDRRASARRPHDADHVAARSSPTPSSAARSRRASCGGPPQARLVVRRELAPRRSTATATRSRCGRSPPRPTRRRASRSSSTLLETPGRATGVTARELAFIKRYLTRSHAFEIDTAQKRVHQALDVELLGSAGRLPPRLARARWTRSRSKSANAALKHAPRARRTSSSPWWGPRSDLLPKVREAIPTSPASASSRYDARLMRVFVSAPLPGDAVALHRTVRGGRRRRDGRRRARRGLLRERAPLRRGPHPVDRPRRRRAPRARPARSPGREHGRGRRQRRPRSVPRRRASP